MNAHIRTIEIEGQKFEVDTRNIKKIDQFRVGDRVKLLQKDYSGYKSCPGVIVGIDAFQNLPTVVIAYVTGHGGYSDVKIEFCYLNCQSKDVEICPMCEDDILPTRDTIVEQFDRQIGKLLGEIESLKTKKEYFLRRFGVAFGAEFPEVPVTPVEERPAVEDRNNWS